MKNIFLSLTMVLLVGNLFAQSSVNNSEIFIDTITTFQLYSDEDLNPIQLFPKATDQNYTMGFGFGISSLRYKSWFIFAPVTKLDNWILGKNTTQGLNTIVLPPSISLNGTAFTPDDLRSTEPITNDRPYAFLLALSTKRGYIDSERDMVFRSELNIGAFGLNIGKWVQTKIHEHANENDTKPPYTPRGWHNQIANGFAPAFLYALSLGKRVVDLPSQKQNRSYFDMKIGTGGSVGYYTQVNGFASLRLGLLDSRNWIQEFNPLGNMSKRITDNNSGRQLGEIYVFASAQPTFMAYNAMLNGTIWRNSVHTLNWNQTNHLILEWTTGISAHIPFKNTKRSLDVTWAVNAGRTSELKTELERTHYWGGVYLGYSW
ncbi:hypothetical protein CHU00_18760 [Sphingobacterium cellulitidis]|uniref:lipid A-modifier LpxR family protein n=1 Tax=Sphingobacterium cellulitidis TaxID=1768011 RepID=UPI000B940441|nr:lipid A-modifier LpxR family protein [Sphingobacterium cellulitidis]OYD44085.1 hypothetical protein CHU00_18760 [Sphingobacterium cellulitidis]